MNEYPWLARASDKVSGWFSDLGHGIMGTNEFRPQATTLDQSQANIDAAQGQSARGSQSYLMQQLNNQMQGNGPSVAALQAKQGVAEALANAGRQAASARGVSRGLALRSSAIGGQQMQGQAIRDAGLMRAQEQLSAQQQYGQMAGQQRMGDTQARQLSLDAAKSNQAAQMQALGYNTQISEGNATRKQKGTGAIFSAAGGVVKGLFSDIRSKEDIVPLDTAAQRKPTFAERIREQMDADGKALAQRQQAEDQARLNSMIAGSNAGYGAQQAGLQRAAADTNASNAGADTSGSGMSAGGIGGAIGGGLESFGNGLISDARSKERIRQLTAALGGRASADPAEASRENLAAVKPYSFRYDPQTSEAMASASAAEVPSYAAPEVAQEVYADARAPREGIMTRELKKSPAGKSVVYDGKIGGKVREALDQKRAIAFALANQAGLDKRLARLEGAR